MGARAPPDQQTKLINAAAAAEIPFILPNEFNPDTGNDAYVNDVATFAAKKQYRDQIEKLGASSWISIVCSFWYEYSLSGGQFGIDVEKRTARFYDEGKTRINTSTWPQVGRAVARLLSLPISAGGGEACLNDFKNRFVYVSSFKLSQHDMLESVQRVTGTGPEDWKVSYVPVKEAYAAGYERMKKGDWSAMKDVGYGRTFFPDGSGNYEDSKGLQNDVLGLPEEDLDAFTKIAIEHFEAGLKH